MCMCKGARIMLHLMLLMVLTMGASKAKADELVPQHLANEVYALARVIYAEARNVPKAAQLDVAHSVMNRVRLNRRDFGGNTVAGVAFHVIKRPDGVLVRQYSGVAGTLDDAWQPGKTDKDWDIWSTSLHNAWLVYTGRAVPSAAMKKALYYMKPKDSSKNSKDWFERNLRPIQWSSVHRFFAERKRTKQS